MSVARVTEVSSSTCGLMLRNKGYQPREPAQSRPAPTASQFRDFVQDDCGECETLGAYKKLAIPDHKPQPNIDDGRKYWAQEQAPDITLIGRAGWTLLHTTAAYYPQSPTNQDKVRTTNFINSFLDVFPCKWCVSDFRDIMKESPPRLENREQFERWMCEAHNQVNEHLGKPPFDCNTVQQRWRKESEKIELDQLPK